LVAADERSGKLLWTFQTGMGWKAGPMTYTIRGKQYIGVAAAGSTVMVFELP
jgi:glucose dehydrogenase